MTVVGRTDGSLKLCMSCRSIKITPWWIPHKHMWYSRQKFLNCQINRVGVSMCEYCLMSRLVIFKQHYGGGHPKWISHNLSMRVIELGISAWRANTWTIILPTKLFQQWPHHHVTELFRIFSYYLHNRKKYEIVLFCTSCKNHAHKRLKTSLLNDSLCRWYSKDTLNIAWFRHSIGHQFLRLVVWSDCIWNQYACVLKPPMN